MEPVSVVARRFEVCTTCGELRGPFVWWWKGERHDLVQQCGCERAAAGGQRTETWVAFDFDRVAEPCYGCGCELLPSGSRFSQWFCRVCRTRATALNAAARHCAVPIGRHSLMARVGARPGDLGDAPEVAALCGRLYGFFDRVRLVSEWAPRVVRANLALVGLDRAGSVAVGDYVDAVAVLDRAERFDVMVRSLSLV